MKKNYEIYFKKIKKIIEDGKRFYIYSDKDGDGLASLILFSIILKKYNKYFDYKLARKYEIPKLKKKVREYDVLVVLDKPIHDKILFQIAEENKNLRIIYIDHHKRKVPDNIPTNMIYLDIRALNFDITSCSAVVYRLGRYLFEDFREHLLLASAGTYLDYFLHKDKLLLEELKEFFSREMDVQLPFILLFFSLILEAVVDNWKTFVKIYLEKGYKGVFEGKISRRVSKWIRKYFSLIDYALNNVKIAGEVVYLFVGNNASIVANILSEIYSDKTVIVFSPYTSGIISKILSYFGIFDIYKISIRSNKLDCGKEIQRFVKSYGISGGGHPEAAGGRIYRKDWKKLVSFFNRLYK